MAGSTSGGISDLSLMVGMKVDPSSLTDAMKTIGDIQSKMSSFRAERGIELGSGGGLEQQKAASFEKEARFQVEFNQLLKEEAAEKAAIAARDAMIAQGREQHLAEQKRLLLDYYQTEEKAGQAREARFQVEFNQLLQLEAAHKAENQRIAAESITNQQSLDAMLEARQRAFNWTQGALATQRRQEEEATTREAAAAAAREQQNRASFRMNMGALSGSSAAPPSGPDVAGGMRDAIERQNAERMAGIMAAIDGEIRLGQTQQAHSDDAERRNAQRLAGIMAAADAELRVGLAIDAEVNAIEGDMTRALRRTLNIEDQINFDYQRRLEAIDAIQGATAQQTAELRLQAAAVRDAATQTAINAGQIGGIGGAGLTGNRIQEIGRGFEDFTVGFSMAKTNIEGVAMGLRGSANNAAQLAASFNPMVGATVAIGASLATVIVPMVARWLYDTKELEKAQDAWNEKLKEAGKEQINVAEALAKMRGVVRDEADKTDAEKGKAVRDSVKKAEKDAAAARDKGAAEQLVVNAAEQKAAEATANKKKLEKERDYALINATADAAANVAAGFLSPEAASQSEASTDALYIKQAEYELAIKQAELADTAAKNDRAALVVTQQAMVTTSEAEAALKKNNAAAIAQAETDVFNAEKQNQKDALDAMGKDELKKDEARIKRKYDLEIERIKHLGFGRVDPRTQALEMGADEIRQNELGDAREKAGKADEARLNKYEDMQQRIDADAGKATKSKEDDIMAAYNKRTEEINRLEGDSDADKLAKKKLHAANLATFTSNMDKEQAAQNDKLAVKRIDAELQANADQQDALQERMQNAGNAAGPSAAMVSGTQAAESAINRALSGSQSVEGTMKSQLKVLQEIHKDLQKQKQAKTVSL